VPNIKSAKKRLRQNVKRTERNLKYKLSYKKIIKDIKKEENEQKAIKLLKTAYSHFDKAAKKNVIHRNKASRLKSKMSKLILKKHSNEKISN